MTNYKGLAQKTADFTVNGCTDRSTYSRAIALREEECHRGTEGRTWEPESWFRRRADETISGKWCPGPRAGEYLKERAEHERHKVLCKTAQVDDVKGAVVFLKLSRPKIIEPLLFKVKR